MLSFSMLAAAMDISSMKNALVILFGILGVLAISALIFTIVSISTKKGSKLVLAFLWIATVLALVCSIMCLIRFNQLNAPPTTTSTQPSTEATTIPTTEATIPTTEQTEPPTEPEPTLAPAHNEDSDPANWGIKWQIMVDGQIVDSYQSEQEISFGHGDKYFTQEGIPSFRGTNYRTGATYGTAEIADKTLTNIWNKTVGGIGKWAGTGWTGQPLVARWDQEALANMGIYESKKAKDGLVEVIQTTMDGNIYFFDIEDGSYTRDPINIGMVVKGTASLDPRGWPILYVGSGIVTNGPPKMYVISLLDNTILYTQSGADTFALRQWFAFDSSPMICAETDSVIWPGESGVLYSLKLNTQYDPQAGTLSVDPQTAVKTRYSSNTGRTIGYESSIIIVQQYAFIGDNGGLFFCVDLNTMELVWAKNVGDDVNATPVFEWGDDGIGYIYLGTSMEYGNGISRIFKINANNGATVWEREFDKIPYDKNVSGGVLSSPLLGKEGTELEGQIIFSISKTPNAAKGLLVALDTETGESVWEKSLSRYAWSSVGAFYTDDGKAYIVLGDSSGTISLMDAKGEVLSTVSLGANIEASPVIFEEFLVVGTRGARIGGVKVS